ncbi:MAG: hypothetical protein R3C68_11725 [Myxococcota bacterium]
MKTIQHIFCRSVLLLITTTTCVWSDPTPPIDTLTCFDKPPARGTILAQVGTETITVEETAETLRQMGRAAIRQHQDPQHMRRFIEDQVRFELLVKAAAERGLERDPDVIDAARKVMVRKLLQRDKDAMASDQMVNDAMIRNAYERDLHEYVQPEKRRLADIQLAPTSSSPSTMLIDTLQASPNDKSLFARLAAKHSTKETRR